MTDTETPQPVEPTSARGWTKIALTVVIAITALVFVYNEWPIAAWLDQAAVDEYHATFAEEPNPLVGNGEGQIGAMFVLLFGHGALLSFSFLVTALVVQNVVNLIWRKPKKVTPA